MELTEAEKQVTEDTRELLVTSDEKQKELTEYQTNSPYSLCDFPRCKFCNTDAHVLYSINYTFVVLVAKFFNF
jgi:hypothetical protein